MPRRRMFKRFKSILKYQTIKRNQISPNFNNIVIVNPKYLQRKKTATSFIHSAKQRTQSPSPSAGGGDTVEVLLLL